ncbi:MAG: hypothetical protein KF689_10065 [Gemmatimonadaceae bacterium]|nr:hypothetical protein [Gemmatimonadaceae bacterium]MCW5826055.1 hypothetical protein [Gemmatimonadaceae bacterium]
MPFRPFRRPIAIAALGVISALSCGREVTAPEGRWVARGFSFAPQFRAGDIASSVLSELVPFDRVRVLLHNAAGDVVVDRVVDFPSGADSVPLSLTVPLGSASGEVMALSLAYINASGDTVFRGGPVSVTVVPTRAGAPPPPAPTIDVDYVGVGADAVSVQITPRADTVLSGNAFAFTGQALGADSLPIANTPIGWRSLSPSLATISAATAGSGTTLAGRGEARIEAFLLSGQTDTVSVVVLPRAATIEVVSGNNQVGLPGQTLSAPVVVRVRASDNLPMAGVSVNFVAGGDGGVGTSPVVTDANGLASTTWTLATTTGAQALTANFTGNTGQPAVFAASTPTVQLLHHFPFTSGLTDVAGSASGSLLGAATVADGVLTLDGEGAHAQFTSALVPSGSWTISLFVRNRTSLSTQVAYLSQGTGLAPALTLGHGSDGGFTYLDTQGGGALAPTIDGLFHHLVVVADSFSNSVTVYRNGTPWITGNPYVSIPSGGTFTRLGRGVDGTDAFFAGDIDELRIYSGALDPSAITALYTAGASAPARIVFTSQPAHVAVGVPIVPAVCVAVEDVLGRPMPSFSGNITMALGNNPGAATLGGTTIVAASGGAACFNNLTVSEAGTGYTLVPSAANAVGTVSAPFDVVDQGLAALVVTTSVGAQVAGVTLTPQIVVEARTAGGAVATDFDGPVTMVVASGPGGAVLSGTTTVVAENGIAVFDDLKLTVAGAGYVLDATTSGAANGSTNAFTVTAGDVSRVAITQAPTTGTTGVALTPAILASAFDAYGNFANTFTGVLSVAIATSPAGAELSGTTDVAAVAGVASFSNLLLDLPGAYTLEVGAEGLTSDTTGTITLAAAAATKLVFAQEPIGGTVNAALAPPVIVHALTDDDALAGGFDGPVTLALGANPGGATLGGTLTVTAVNGVATFPDLSINVAANGYTLSATSSGLLPSTTSEFDIVLAGVTNSWTNPAGGLWSEPTNWSQGRVPVATDTVAIDLAGTYTVTLSASYAGALVQVGGASGTQTLDVTAGTLSTGLGVDIAPNGVLQSRNASAVGGSGSHRVRGLYRVVGDVVHNAPLYVDTVGTLEVIGGGAGSVSARLTTSSTMTIDGAAVMSSANGGWTSTIRVTAGQLHLGPTGTLLSDIGASGSRIIDAALDNEGSIEVQQSLQIDRAGTTHRNRGTIDVATQTLLVTQSGASPSFTNEGLIIIRASRQLRITGGSVDFAPGEIVGDSGVVTLWNVGAASVDFTTSRSRWESNSAGVTFTHPVTIAAGDSLRFFGGNFTAPEWRPEGRHILLGNAVLFGPVVTAPGGTIEVRGNGTIGSVEATIDESFTNTGTIELSSMNLGYSAGLRVQNGPLVNAVGGIIRSAVGAGGIRTLDAQLDNSGTLEVLANLTVSRINVAHVHRDSLTIGAGTLTFNLGPSGSFTNLGAIEVLTGRQLAFTTGTVHLRDGSLVSDSGTVSFSGTAIDADVGSLRARLALGTGTSFVDTLLVPVGDSLRVLSGTLNAPAVVVAGRVVALGSFTLAAPLVTETTGTLESRSSSVAGTTIFTVTDGFTNHGTIELVSANAGYSNEFRVTNGTLVNAATGTIRSLVGAGGARTLGAELDNSGTLDIQQALAINRSASAHVNRSAIELTAANLSVVQSGAGPSFTNLGSITMAPDRQMSVTGGTLDLEGGVLTGHDATLSISSLSLVTTPEALRARVHFNAGTSFASPFTIPSDDSLRVVGGTLHAPDLIVAGRLVALGSATITAPVTTEESGVLEARSSNIGGSVNLSVSSGFTNTGTIELRAADAGYSSTFTVSSGTLVNAPSGTVRTFAGSGGLRTIAAELDNDGTLDFQTTTTLSRASAAHVNRGSFTLDAANLTVTQTGTSPSFTNLGSIHLATGRTLSITGGAVNLSDGTLVGDSATLSLGNVALTATPASARTRFHYNTGTSYTTPYTIPAGDSLIVVGGTLGGPGLTVVGRYVSAGSSNIAAPVTMDPAGTLEARSSNLFGGVTLTVVDGFTNEGTIELISANLGYGTTFAVTNGTLVNADGGRIRSLVGSGGTRSLTAQLDNSGTIELLQPLTINKASAAHVNRSTLVVDAANVTVSQTGTTPSFTNLGHIEVQAGRSLAFTGGMLDLANGTLDGDDATLSLNGVTLVASPDGMRTRLVLLGGTAFDAPYTVPVGDSLRLISGTLGGPSLTVAGRLVALSNAGLSTPLTVPSSGTIEVRSQNTFGAASLTVADGFTNEGTIELIANNLGYSTTFAVTNGTLVNAASGTIRTLPGTGGGTRTLAAALDNDGALDLQHPLLIQKNGAAHVHRSTFALGPADLSISQTGGSFQNLGDITMATGRALNATGIALDLDEGTLVGDTATLNMTNVSLAMTPATVRTRLRFNSGTSFASAHTVPAGDSLVVTGGTIGGPGLSVDGHLVALAPITISAPFAVGSTGHLEARSTNAFGSVTVTVGNGFTNEGLITLVSANLGYATALTVNTGTLVNALGATIRSLAGSGGTRALNAQLENSGTLLVEQPLTITRASGVHLNAATGLIDATAADLTVAGAGQSFTNLGAITLGSGRTMSVTAGALDLANGTLDGESGTLSTSNVTLTVTPASARTRFNFGAGTTLSAAHTIPVGDSLRIVGGTLNGPGLSIEGRLVAMATATLNLPVTLPSTGVLDVRASSFAGGFTFTIANGFTNEGLILLDAQNLGYTPTLAVTNGTLVNASGGTIRAATGSGGSRVLRAELDNSGTLDIQQALTLDRAASQHINRSAIALTTHNLTITQSGAAPSFQNLGVISLDAGRTLAVSGGAVDLSGGQVNGFGGTLQLTGAALTIGSPAAARTRLLFSSTASALAEDLTIPAGDSLRISGGTLNGPGTLFVEGRLAVVGSITLAAPVDNTGGEVLVNANSVWGSVTLTLPSGFTNRGLLALNAESSGWTSAVAVTSGTLSNQPDATIRTLVGGGGGRTLQAQLDNQGLLDVVHPLTINRASSVHQSSGTVAVASGATLIVSQSGTTPSFTNTGNITLGGTGTQLTASNGAFSATTGSITGSGTLAFAGTVSADLAVPAVKVPLNLGAGTTLANALTIPLGDTLTLVAGTLAGPGLAVNGTLVVNGVSTVAAPLTTGPSALIDIRTTTLTTPQSWTNNGTLRLSSISGAANPTLTMTGQTLTNASTGLVDMPTGFNVTRYINAGTIENEGTMTVASGFNNNGIVNQHGTMSILSGTTTIPTLNLFAGHTTTVNGTLSVPTACSNAGNPITGEGVWPAACNP